MGAARRKEPILGKRWLASRNIQPPKEVVRDGRISAKKIREYAISAADNRGEFEKRYEGYRLSEITPYFNDVNGAFSSPEIVPIPKVHLAFLDNVPVLNDLLNNWSLMEWFVIVLIIVLQFFIYKTVWGLRLRAVGQFPEAAKTAGIKVDAVKYRAMAISGLIGGLAGAHLSLGYSNQFIENMTSSRGFMGVAAMYFGGANPVLSSIGCLLFGLADSIGARLQAYGRPSQFGLMMPYIVTIVVLAISMMTQLGNERRRQSSLTGIGTEAAIDK